jgi:hypothetical protein
VAVRRSLALVLVLFALGAAGCPLFPEHDGGTGDGGEGDAGELPVIPPTTVGEPCTLATDCQTTLGPMAICQQGSVDLDGIVFYYTDGYCTLNCTPAPDSCPAGSHCLVASGAPYGQCVRTCNLSRECRTGSGYCCVPSQPTKFCGAPADSLSYCGF